jgi:predicted  nucleic acid-binding Zn-ribbon protein
VAEERQALEREKAQLETDIARLAAERDALRPTIGADALRLFDHVARQRRGAVVAEARDGHCTYCHVRLRPQVFNEIRRNDRIVQCDSCLRILYFVQPADQAAGA